MRKLILITIYTALCLSCTMQSPSGYVNPFIGTDGHGHVYPGASFPYGMVQLSPDTRLEGWDACGGYHYTDSTIIGFSHTHLCGTGCADLGDILFRPSSFPDEPVTEPVPVRFRHEDESARPGYYSVRVGDVKVELTASARCGAHRYTFTGKGKRSILVDLRHNIGEQSVVASFLETSENGMQLSGGHVTNGWVPDHHVCFSARFVPTPEKIDIIDSTRAVVLFPECVKQVEAFVGLSGVSAGNARMNLDACPESFEEILSTAEKTWAESLGKIKVKGGKRSSRICFYTALYHSMLTPNLMSDINGQYRVGDRIETMPEGEKFYSTFSFWDTHRAWLPLNSLIDTSLVADIVRSSLRMYDAWGVMPVWPLASGETNCMIGYHSAPFIADAYSKGIRGFDAVKALEGLDKSSTARGMAAEAYAEQGYIPADRFRESVSMTLEYAYDDWCTGSFARQIGDEKTAEKYLKRALNYKNVFDGSTLFFRGRNGNGSLATPFSPTSRDRAFTEAVPWQYRFFVPHDIFGLEQLFGSRDSLLNALDKMFVTEGEETGISDISGLIGQYAHGNEPSHGTTFLYTCLGQPEKTQRRLREIMRGMYGTGPDGLCGNEDCGQMSAWYVLAAAGLYQICPGDSTFVLSSPAFRNIRIRLASGNDLNISTRRPRATYISSVRINGRKTKSLAIDYSTLAAGADLDFSLSFFPHRNKFNATANSLSEKPFVATPFTTAEIDLFKDSLLLDLGCSTAQAEIRYTVDGSEPLEESALYAGPLTLRESAVIRAKAFREGFEPSPEICLNCLKAEFKKAADRTGIASGVLYELYEGHFKRTADIFRSGTKLHSGIMAAPSISNCPMTDHFAYIFTGLIDVPESGIWEFATISDDGSILEVDGLTVVNNDGSHPATLTNGMAALEKGLHPFRLIYFEDYEGEFLDWKWKRREESGYYDIPAENLYHKL